MERGMPTVRMKNDTVRMERGHTAFERAQTDAAIVSTIGRGTVLPKVVVGDDAAPALRRTPGPRYRELVRIGEGGLGEVTLAEDSDIGRQIAIKRLRDDRDEGSLMRFVEEVRVMGELDHPNIVPVHDVGCDENGRFYFVMKRLDGETVETIIERLRDGDRAAQQQYPLSVRIEIFHGMLRAMQFAHANGILHRDIKPANVMVGRFGEVVVLDWGIAKRLEHGDALDRHVPVEDDASLPHRPFRTRLGTLLGTPAYMSPEQARGENAILDARSDIFSLSVLFYELLTLRHYLEDAPDLRAVLDGVRTKAPVPACSVAGSGVSVELSNFVARGMAKDANDRFQSVGEMIESLRSLVSGRFRVSCPVTLAKRLVSALGHAIDRHPRATGMTMTAAGLAMVAGLVTLGLRIAGVLG